MTQSGAPSLRGITGEEASAAKRGFHYQDLVTLQAWLALAPDEVLHIEVAEDFAVQTPDQATLSQVRQVAHSLTLVHGDTLTFLDKVLRHQASNPETRLQFAYVTTAPIGRERATQDRPAGIAGIEYWNQVKAGAHLAPLIEVLRRNVDPTSGLAQLLATASESEIRDRLIDRVHWAVNAPKSSVMEARLREAIAGFAQAETGYPKVKGRNLLGLVLHEVTRVSTLKDDDQRQLRREQLLTLISDATVKYLPLEEYEKLTRDADIGRNLPTAEIDAQIKFRLRRLQQTRFFAEANADQQAMELAKAIRQGGVYQAGTQELRGLALSWCARGLIEHDQVLATQFVDEAAALRSDLQHVRHVKALLLGKVDPAAARTLLGDDNTPEAHTIRFVIERYASTAHALDWITEASLVPADLDADGQFIVLQELMKDHRWEALLRWREGIADVAIASCLALPWGMAYAGVAAAVRPDQIFIALQGPPLVDELELRNSAEALALRRHAAQTFREFNARAREHGLTRHAGIAHRYALWLELQDQDTRTTAIAEIGAAWGNQSDKLTWLPLALLAGIDVDQAAAQASIRRHHVVYGALNEEAAHAQMALLLVTHPRDWVDDWPRLRGWVADYFNENFLALLHIQALIRAGYLEQARAAIDGAAIPESVSTQLLLEIDRPSPAQTLEVCRALAETDRSPAVRRRLIQALEDSGLHSEAIETARGLLHESGARDDAEILTRLLMRNGQWSDALAVLDNSDEVADLSPDLAAMRCDALFNLGRWAQVPDAARDVPKSLLDRNQLEVRLAIYSGQWEQLGVLLEAAPADPTMTRDERLQFAGIAFALGKIALSKQLTMQAAEQAVDDAASLFQCYVLAVRGRWENEAVVNGWLQRSIALSDPTDGPVRSGDLSELIAMAPKWREKTQTLQSGIATGQLFLAMAAGAMRRPLTTLLVGAIEQNLATRNPARRTPLPTYAGTEREVLSPLPRRIALDATALLTLARLDLLSPLAQTFEKIYLPHSLGAWLFKEIESVQFHQPSQIEKARQVLRGITRSELRVAKFSREVVPKLVSEAGYDIAQLLLAVERDRATEKTSFVIHPAPLYRPDSLRETLASIDSYTAYFRSLPQLIESLMQYGAISDLKHTQALAYLKPLDEGWREDTILPRKCTLYLSDLALSYLQQLDLLGALSRANFDVVVAADVQQDALALDQLDLTSQSILEALERIRRFMLAGAPTGLVQMLPKQKPRRKKSTSLPTEPPELASSETTDATNDAQTIEEDDPFDDEIANVNGGALLLLRQIFLSTPDVECLIFDDRAANRFTALTSEDGRTVPVRSTLEVLDWMLATGALRKAEWLRLRTDLRRFGYLFVPFERDELLAALDASFVTRNTLEESHAARAIRENYLLAQASGMLQHPQETRWISANNRATWEAILELWSRSVVDADTEVRANWLVELSRFDGFAGTFLGEFNERRWNEMDAMVIGRLLLGVQIDPTRREAYNNWLEQSYLATMAHSRPAVFKALCELIEQHISAIPTYVRNEESGVGHKERKVVVAKLANDVINDLPGLVRDRILSNDDSLDRLGLKRASQISLHLPGRPSFDAEAMYAAARAAVDGVSGASLRDTADNDWIFSQDQEGTVWGKLAMAATKFELRHARLFSKNTDVRVQHLTKVLEEHGLSAGQFAPWLEALRNAPLPLNALDDFESDLADTPYAVTAAIRSAFESGKASSYDLVPLSARYYDRLVGAWQDQASLPDYATTTGPFASWSSELDHLGYALLRSGHALLVPVALIGEVSPSTIQQFVQEQLTHLDLWSLIGLLEGLVHRPDAFTNLAATTIAVLNHFVSITVEQTNRFELASALAAHVDATLHTSAILEDRPPYWRRLASLSHAALIERVFLQADGSVSSLTAWAEQSWALFQSASLVDLVQEPRWGGHMLLANQLQQELIGRALTALEPFRDDIASLGLDRPIFGDQDNTLEYARQFMFSALPGPLEGAQVTSQPLPESTVEYALRFLEDENEPLLHRVYITAHVFGLGLPPPALIARLTEETVLLDLEGDLDGASSQVQRLIVYLSLAAASARHRPFAEAVHQLLRHRPTLPLALRLHAGLTACAWTDDEHEWEGAVVEWSGEIARQDLTPDEAEHVLFVLGVLSDIKPLLRAKLAEHVARLRATSQQ